MKTLKITPFFLEHKSHACPAIRIFSPLYELRKKGLVVLGTGTTVEGGRVNVNLGDIADSDIVIIQRQAAREEVAGPIFDVAERFKKKVLIEMDDLLFDAFPSHPDAETLGKMSNGIIESLKRADAVTCTTHSLKRHLLPFNDRVYVLPNCIDMDIWSGAGKKERASARNKIIIGYGGTPTHTDDLRMITPAIKKILSIYGGEVEFRFWGCITDELRDLQGVVFVRELVKDYREYARVLGNSDIDVAVCPLAENSFNVCKSNIKYLEYSICGIPGIYSMLPPYADSVVDGETGILSENTVDSWFRSMERLLESEDLRRKIAENAYRDVIGKYTIENNAFRWNEVFRKITDETSAGIFVEKAKNGSLSMKVRADDGAIKPLHSTYAPENEAKSIVDAFDFDGKGLLVVLGLGLGYHVRELAKRFPDAKMIVVEQSREIFDIAGREGGLSDLENRVEFLAGLSADEVMKEVTRRQIRAGMAPMAIFPLSSAVSAFRRYYGPILSGLGKAVSSRFWERLKYPKFREETAKVALMDCGYFLTREVGRSLARLGNGVIRIPVRKGEKGDAIISRVISAIAEYGPDFFLTINHLGFDEDGVLTSFFESIEMPVASWYVDSPNLIVRAFEGNVSPYVSLFLWDRGYMGEMEEMGFESITYLPLATDEEVFRPMRLNGRKLKRYSADVGFVGNSMVKPVSEKLKEVPLNLHPIVEKLAASMSGTGATYDEAMAGLEGEERVEVEKLSGRERSDLEGAVLWKATLLYRRSCLQGIERFSPRIHGDKGWQELLGDGFDLKGELGYYTELPLFYNACKVNFNATNMQMGSAVNQRVFDVPACGSFLLTDCQDALEELFDVGNEMIVYRERKEIPELVRFYLDNPEKRDKIAGRGLERVLRDHTYAKRITTMIEVMRKRYRR